MQRRRHVDALHVSSLPWNSTYFCAEVGAHPDEKILKSGSGPLSDVVPALDTNVFDDLFLFRQCIDLLETPRPSVLDETGQLKLPTADIDGFDVLDFVVGVGIWAA